MEILGLSVGVFSPVLIDYPFLLALDHLVLVLILLNLDVAKSH